MLITKEPEEGKRTNATKPRPHKIGTTDSYLIYTHEFSVCSQKFSVTVSALYQLTRGAQRLSLSSVPLEGATSGPQDTVEHTTRRCRPSAPTELVLELLLGSYTAVLE